MDEGVLRMTLDLAERQRCSICGVEYVWDHQHRCPADVLRVINAADARASIREIVDDVVRPYGQRLQDGFWMMRGEYV